MAVSSGCYVVWATLGPARRHKKSKEFIGRIENLYGRPARQNSQAESSHIAVKTTVDPGTSGDRIMARASGHAIQAMMGTRNWARAAAAMAQVISAARKRAARAPTSATART